MHARFRPKMKIKYLDRIITVSTNIHLQIHPVFLCIFSRRWLYRVRLHNAVVTTATRLRCNRRSTYLRLQYSTHGYRAVTGEGKGKGTYTLDIAPLRESSPQKPSGMARVLTGSHSFTCTPTRSSAIGMSHTCLSLPNYNSWYSFTDPGGMEGWVGLEVVRRSNRSRIASRRSRNCSAPYATAKSIQVATGLVQGTYDMR